MSAKRKVDNLMALAVLATLIERPMHRYEIAATLRERGKGGQMDIKWGSLYTVVQNLEKHGFLEVAGTEREGGRPERTIYRVTAAGRAETDDWLRELIGAPEREPGRFLAGLSIVALLPPDDLITLLDQRLAGLHATLEAVRADLDEASRQIPRIFLIESEFEVAMLTAQAQWVSTFRNELVAGTFPDLDLWRKLHVGPGQLSEDVAEYAETAKRRLRDSDP